MSAELVLIIRMLVVILIYGFLAGTLLILWKTTFPKKQDAANPIPTISFQISPDGVKKSFDLAEIYIGRDKNANFLVSDESVSNLHARIFWKEKNWWIEDLNSTNGTFLNEEKITSPTIIINEDLIQLGNTKFEITLTD